MRLIILSFSLVLLLAPIGRAQGGDADPWADSVVLFVHGEGQWYGEDFFPQNVLGPPDTTARPYAPSQSPEEIFSLGPYGAILLAFTDNVVVDGPGPDLTVFENAFFVGNDSSVLFGEPAIVFGSEDGVVFYQFPIDTTDPDPLNWHNVAGVHPTDGSQDPTDPSVSGGDHFDIHEIGIDTLRYVLIADAFFLNWNPMATGFDLDAVVAIHWAPSEVKGLKSDPWPDKSLHIAIGEHGGAGMGNFPQNVLGPPDPMARDTLPARPSETVTLGHNGFVFLEFEDDRIMNGPGYDFNIFENAFFLNADPDSLVAEPGMVAVSSDGFFYALFPFDTLTLEGLAGITPTNGDQDPQNPSVSGGDPFDLDVLGSLNFPSPFDAYTFQSVRYVMVRDAHQFNRFLYHENADGFDLDAVVSVNDESDIREKRRLPPNESPTEYLLFLNGEESLQLGGFDRLDVFSVAGRRVISFYRDVDELHLFTNLKGGYYFAILWNKGRIVKRRLLVVK